MTQRNGNQGAREMVAPPPSPPPRPGGGLLWELVRADLLGPAAPCRAMAAVVGSFTLLLVVLGVYVGLCVAVLAVF
ncbi:MAG: hypothetical protein RMK29_06100 [Myxococcales bacterium]|nr:hypothetical protein [Myxococcota bacterium]MDW8281263.1 hypothetical protein [Myxococcales bacterium]